MFQKTIITRKQKESSESGTESESSSDDDSEMIAALIGGTGSPAVSTAIKKIQSPSSSSRGSPSVTAASSISELDSPNVAQPVSFVSKPQTQAGAPSSSSFRQHLAIPPNSAVKSERKPSPLFQKALAARAAREGGVGAVAREDLNPTREIADEFEVVRGSDSSEEESGSEPESGESNESVEDDSGDNEDEDEDEDSGRFAADEVQYEWENPLMDDYDPLDMVIASLNKHITMHEKSRMKNQLDIVCESMDHQLNTIIDSDYQGFITSISAFGQIAQRVSDSETRVKTLLDKLTNCRKLLHIKRESLKMMYADNLANREMITLLNQLDDVRNYPKRYDEHVTKKQFLHASRLLCHGVELLDSQLDSVGALKDLKRALKERKENLPQLLIEELHNHLYWKTKYCKNTILGEGKSSYLYSIAWSDGDSDEKATLTASRERVGSESGFNRTLSNKSETSRASTQNQRSVSEMMSATRVRRAKRRSSKASMPLGNQVAADGEDLTPVETLTGNPEEDCFQFMVFLMDSLAHIGALPNVIVAIRRRMSRELSIVTERAFTAVVDEQDISVDNEVLDSPELFKSLFEHIFVQYRYILQSHVFVTQILRKKITESSLKGRGNGEKSIDIEVLQELYSDSDVWVCMQEELRRLLCEYLMVSKEEEEQFMPAKKVQKYEQKLNENLERILTHQKDTSSQLFAFSNSNYAFGVNSLLKEEQQKKLLGVNIAIDISSDDKYTAVARPRLLCKASPLNITVVYKILTAFVDEVDMLVGGPSSELGLLKFFVESFFQNRFLVYIQDSITTKSRQSLEASDAFSLPIEFDFSSVCSQYPLTKGVLVVDTMINDLIDILLKIPAYTADFMEMICKLLQRYMHTCHNMYEECMRLDNDAAKNIIHSWSSDKNINQLVQTYGTWQYIKASQKSKKDHSAPQVYTKGAEYYMEEYELEMKYIGNRTVEAKEITLDPQVLKTVANLHQSLEWLALNLQNLTEEMTSNSSGIQYKRTAVPTINIVSILFVSI